MRTFFAIVFGVSFLAMIGLVGGIEHGADGILAIWMIPLVIIMSICVKFINKGGEKE